MSEALQKLIRKWKRDDCRMGAGGASCHHEQLRQAACNQAKQMVKEIEAVLASELGSKPAGVSEEAIALLREDCQQLGADGLYKDAALYQEILRAVLTSGREGK